MQDPYEWTILTIELSSGELLVTGLMLVFTSDKLVTQVLNVSASSTLNIRLAPD